MESGCTCPVSFPPYLATRHLLSNSYERAEQKRQRRLVKDAFTFISIKEPPVQCGGWRPFRFLIRIIEWWQTGETRAASPGYRRAAGHP
ncbi:hypothetical protein ACVXHA_21925 [Escherichia coli]